MNNIKKFNRVRNERSMNLQLKTKTQLYNINYVVINNFLFRIDTRKDRDLDKCYRNWEHLKCNGVVNYK